MERWYMKPRPTTKLRLCGLTSHAEATTTLKEPTKSLQEFSSYFQRQLVPRFILLQPKSQYQHLKVLVLSLPAPVPPQFRPNTRPKKPLQGKTSDPPDPFFLILSKIKKF